MKIINRVNTRALGITSLSLMFLAATPALNAADHEGMDHSKMDGKTEMPAGSGAALKAGDAKFVSEAASGGMFEVEASKLAMQRATDPELKKFAQMMVKEHTENAAMLKKVATQKGAQVPATLMPEHQKMLDKLKEQKAGKDFDDAYREAMVMSHKETVDKFKDARDSVADAELKGYVTKSLPTLEHHLQMAEKLEMAKR